MLTRRAFLTASSVSILACRTRLSPRERVDRALNGQATDRTPYSYWHHFLDERRPPLEHANSTLDFHRRFHTDLVKVMSDYPYPVPTGAWHQPVVYDNPFPRQIQALQLIRDGLNGQAHFVETIFNPYNVAEKLSSKEAVAKLAAEDPQRLLDALEAIAKSQANHARRAIEAGASGVFLAIANSADENYSKFGEPFDKSIVEAVRTAPLNVLHVHGDKIDLPRFYDGWYGSAINYSAHGTKIPLAQVRSQFGGLILGGLDEVRYRELTTDELAVQYQAAKEAAGMKLILTPGCSVPNDSTDVELSRLKQVLRA